jgi:hypothetical protein
MQCHKCDQEGERHTRARDGLREATHSKKRIRDGPPATVSNWFPVTPSTALQSSSTVGSFTPMTQGNSPRLQGRNGEAHRGGATLRACGGNTLSQDRVSLVAGWWRVWLSARRDYLSLNTRGKIATAITRIEGATRSAMRGSSVKFAGG